MKAIFILGLLLNLGCCVVFGASIDDIALYSGLDKADEEDNRSLSIVPRAVYDGNTICIYSDIVTNNVAIAVKNA